jgi:hypothetical protein
MTARTKKMGIWSLLIRWHADAPEDAWITLWSSREAALQHVRKQFAETIERAEEDDDLTADEDMLDFLYTFGIYIRVDKHDYAPGTVHRRARGRK